MVLLVPLRAIAQRDLRRFACAGLASMAIVFPIYLTIPLRAPARAFSATDALGRLLMFERVYDAHGANAFPSYHFLWALLAGATLAHCGRLWRYAGPLWAIAIGISCITTGQHALIDVLAAAVVFPLVLYLPGLYRHLVRLTERLGNSYRASRVGPLRIINHGIYSGLAGFVGVVIIGALAGPGHLLAIAAVALCSMIGAALWAQIIEGSPRLLRPFGYYGAVVGAVVGACCAPLLGSSTPLMLAAFATAAPMIQAIGRLRCIVQGCCHGKPLAAESGQELGLRITHPSSRVCKLSPFAGMPIHPTPLYSIIGNLFITVPMIRLWMLHAPLTLLMGMYLLLAGFARFIEEAYRGEPQTRRIAGLPEYQWLAIVSVMTGAFVTALPCAQMAPGLSPWGVSVPTIALALAAGLFTAFAMSMDFPGSNRRFSRLTG
jgi:prolipoprotein diacylglyceryltransferase